MPSPFGHALAGFAVGWLAAPRGCRVVSSPPQNPGVPAVSGERWRSRAVSLAWRWRWPLAFATAGVAADLDLLVGLHSRYTHSMGAAMIVFAGAWLVLRRAGGNAAGAAFAIALGYASHVLLDWLGSDTTPPYGVMALWPFSADFYHSPLPIFLGVSRRYWLALAWAQNGVSVAREFLILVPLAAAALWLRPPARRPFA